MTISTTIHCHHSTLQLSIASNAKANMVARVKPPFYSSNTKLSSHVFKPQMTLLPSWKIHSYFFGLGDADQPYKFIENNAKQVKRNVETLKLQSLREQIFYAWYVAVQQG